MNICNVFPHIDLHIHSLRANIDLSPQKEVYYMKKFIAIFLICLLILSLSGCDKACVDIELSKDTIIFTKKGQSKGLKVTTDPKDTSDEVEFESDDEDVATVNEDGLVRAVGPGETTIIVRCGDEVTYCEVICDFGDAHIGDDEHDDIRGSSKCSTCTGNKVIPCPTCSNVNTGSDKTGKQPSSGNGAGRYGDWDDWVAPSEGNYAGEYGDWDDWVAPSEGNEGKVCKDCNGNGTVDCPDCT